MEDEGRTPLLPRDGRPQEIKLPTTKLASLGVSLAFAAFTDLAVCWLVCTGGFSDDWRQRLGTLSPSRCSVLCLMNVDIAVLHPLWGGLGS